MAKIVAISGLGEGAAVPEPQRPNSNALLAFGLVMVFAGGIFVGTLMIDPKKGKRR